MIQEVCLEQGQSFKYYRYVINKNETNNEDIESSAKWESSGCHNGDSKHKRFEV